MKQTILMILLLCAAQRAVAVPGWQQEVNTRIQVTLDDQAHMLRGHVELTYSNHSPDTLTFIYMHLWPNAYLHDRTAFAAQQVRHGETKFYFAPGERRGYIDSLSFSVDGLPVSYSSSDNTPDVARIDLDQPLLPGSSVLITTPFRVKIPDAFSRLGHTGQAYFISQWFPKPAVYDRKGWHPMPYLNYGEFYSEFGTYDVAITLPRNYVVMATGNYQDPAEVAWLDSLATAPLPPDTLYRNTWPASDDVMKTVRMREENVHDFAWFADKRWVVRKDTALLAGADDPVAVYAAFLPDGQKAWLQANEYQKAALHHYSNFAGTYPYRTIKAVEGDMKAGGGMEYPTITIIDKDGGRLMLKEVIIHEAGHNWFYGVIASNERDFAWMDEGINSFYENKTVQATRSGASLLSGLNSRLGRLLYYQSAATGEDQAMSLSSDEFTGTNYGQVNYQKASMMLEWLEQYMGADIFAKAMQDYYDTWKFRHPYPEDLREVLERHTEKPLGWFFDHLLDTDRPVEFSISRLKRSGDTVYVTLRNRSGIPAPAGLDVYDGDSIRTSVWSSPFAQTTVLAVVPGGSWTRIRISESIPDLRPANSVYRNYGLLRRRGIRPGLIAGDNMQEKYRFWVSPAAGYNYYDGVHLGLVLHNLTLPESGFRFVIAPLYSTGSGSFTGAGSLGYGWYPRKGAFSEVLVQADGKSFHGNRITVNTPDPLFFRYSKLAPSVVLRLREPRPGSVKRMFTLKGYAVQEDLVRYTTDPVDSLDVPSHQGHSAYYGLVRYEHRNERTFNPFGYGAELQAGNSFVKLHLSGNARIDYHIRNKALHVRAFAGKFFHTGAGSSASVSRYWLNTTFSGPNDYLYDHTFLGRAEVSGLAARQTALVEGGFKMPTGHYANPLGRSDNWLVALNLETDIPWVPLRLFLDVGTFAGAAGLNPSGGSVLFNGGVALHLPGDILSVYLPLVMSKDFTDYQKQFHTKGHIIQGISFNLNLHRINWLQLPGILTRSFI